MGYTTDFSGSFKLNRPATATEIAYINAFANTRRMGRNVAQLMAILKGEKGLPYVFNTTIEQNKHIKALEKSGLNVSVTPKTNKDTRTAEEIYGVEGEFVIDDEATGVLDYNTPPKTQAGLWNHWVLSKDGKTLHHDGGEKTYYYTEWLTYMIENFFKKWGIILNGEVTWTGEDRDDIGKIVVTDNKVEILEGEVSYKKK